MVTLEVAAMLAMTFGLMILTIILVMLGVAQLVITSRNTKK